MNIYNMIKTMSDEELERYLSFEIHDLECLSKLNNNGDIIGFYLSHNPKDYNLLSKKNEMVIPVQAKCFYSGYVPKGMKIVYGFSATMNGLTCNEGMYYVMDDDSYIYDFCKKIRSVDVENEEDLFEYILLFLKKYFGVINDRTRDEMFQLILKNDKTYHTPVREHKFSDFKKKGNAMCSEYAIMANNILSIFGFDSYLIIGQEEDSNKDIEGHAFNFVSYTDSNYERKDLLVDFAHCVNVYDINFKKIGESPYIIPLDEFNEEFVNDFIYNEKHLTSEDYSYMVMGDSFLKLVTDRERNYYIGSKILIKNLSNGRQK